MRRRLSLRCAFACLAIETFFGFLTWFFGPKSKIDANVFRNLKDANPGVLPFPTQQADMTRLFKHPLKVCLKVWGTVPSTPENDSAIVLHRRRMRSVTGPSCRLRRAGTRGSRSSYTESSLHGRGIARAVRSRILPGMILTLTHSARLLPSVVKITPVPRTISRAIPRPLRSTSKGKSNEIG